MNTKQIRDFADVVDGHRSKLRELEATLSTLNLTHGQACPNISINGVKFDLADMSRESGWMPRALKATEAIRAEAIKLIQARIKAQQSRLEGAEFNLRQALKDHP